MLVSVDGRPLASEKREKVITDPRLVTFASQADVAFRLLDLGVVCVHCGQPPVCNNHPSDAHWKMECPCTTRVLKNPAPKREQLLS
jgi:hypothetical protein